MSRRLAVAWLAAAFLATPAAADEIDDLIAALASDDYGRRTEAETALAALGPDVRPRIEAALEASDDPERTVRLRRVLDGFALAPDAAGAGIGASIAVDRDRAAPGDAFTVTVVLHNSTSRRIEFATQLGLGDVLESADRLRAGEAVFEYDGPFGCGTGLPEAPAGLDPGERREIRYSFRVAEGEGGALTLVVVAPSTFGEAPYRTAIQPGEVRIAYLLDESSAAGGSWKGTIRREVVVHVGR